MAEFSSFADTYPDPNNKIGLAGQADASGTAGPGFASVKLSSIEPILQDRGPSSRINTDDAYHHKWMIEINYNPLTCAQFYVLNAFLSCKRNSLEPFYVSVPPYNVQTTASVATAETYERGQETILVSGTGLSVGEIFSFANSTKIYFITRVETNSEYNTQDIQPGASQERIHITPALQRDTDSGTQLNFTDQKFYVVETNLPNDYTITPNNLYQFSVAFEEILDA